MIPWLPNRTYWGIDRLPSVPNVLDLRGPEERVWDQYLKSLEDGSLARDLSVAQDIQTKLGQIGRETEILFVSIESEPDFEDRADPPEVSEIRRSSEEWLIARTVVVQAPPREFVAIGLDVSTPVPDFHSVILEPGPISHDEEFERHLNDMGLVDEEDLSYANALMARANESGYLLGMFCVLGIRACVKSP